MDLANYIRDIPDFPKPGILFKDITPLLAEPRAFRQAIQQMDHAPAEPGFEITHKSVREKEHAAATAGLAA